VIPPLGQTDSAEANLTGWLSTMQESLHILQVMVQSSFPFN